MLLTADKEGRRQYTAQGKPSSDEILGLGAVEVELYAMALGDSRRVTSLDCNRVLENPARVEPCLELQLVRAVLE